MKSTKIRPDTSFPFQTSVSGLVADTIAILDDLHFVLTTRRSHFSKAGRLIRMIGDMEIAIKSLSSSLPPPPKEPEPLPPVSITAPGGPIGTAYQEARELAAMASTCRAWEDLPEPLRVCAMRAIAAAGFQPPDWTDAAIDKARRDATPTGPEDLDARPF